jgi:hypothetical protein
MNLISLDKKYKTRDGRDVRVLCVDANDDNYPVVALIGNDVHRFTSKGSFDMGYRRGFDLIEVPEEKTMWLEIFRYKHWSEDAKPMIGVHSSREEMEAAVIKQQFGYQCIAIKKITYVEGEGVDG